MTICCYGDSNTFGYDPRGFLGDRYDAPWPEVLSELTGWDVLNSGSCGRRVPIHETMLPNNADLRIVMLGTNDLLNGEEPHDIALRMERFLSQQDGDRVILIAPPHLSRGEWVTGDGLIRRSEALAEEYRAVALRMAIPFLDAGEWNVPLCYDGVHFTEIGHRIFAEHVCAAIESAT